MAKTPGSKNWSTLAVMSDREIYEYFLTRPKTQNKQHAYHLTVKVRCTHDSFGKERGTPLYASDVRKTIDPAVYGMAFDKLPPIGGEQTLEIPPEDTLADPDDSPEQAPEIVPAPKQAMAPHSDAGSALYDLVRPHMASDIATMVAHAVARIQAPEKLVVLNPTGERKELSGTHHHAAAKVLKLVNSGLNVMMVGPAGCGKTMIAATIAQALELELTTVSFSAGISESALLGRLLPLGDAGQFRYLPSPLIKAYEHGGCILLDEFDAVDANCALVLNSMTGNNYIDIEARQANGLPVRVTRHPKCVIIAAANTWGSGADLEYVGRGRMDESSLDRFYRLSVDYDEKLERQLGSQEIVEYVQELRRKARIAKIKKVVSSRMITRLERAVAGGIPLHEAQRDALASWSTSERSQVQS